MVRRRTALSLAGLGAAVALVGAWASRARRSPSACPYGQRFVLEFPRLVLTRPALRDVLDPRPGQRLLEVGPGIGYYSLDVASALLPGGTLDILDVQKGFLNESLRRARARGLPNVRPTRGDAQALPYRAGHFDGAFLVATLGEVADKSAALRELRRVIRRGGRLVVGEGLPDPHMVSAPALERLASEAGFRLERRVGGRLGYLASLVAE